MQDPAATELRLPQASVEALRAAVEEAQRDRASLDRHANAVREVIYRLDQGRLRVAEKGSTGWTVHGWIQQAINLFFSLAQSEVYAAGDLRFFDKIPPKRPAGDFRVVPPGAGRYGAHVGKGAIVMPGYVNIGARVGGGSMVDTWATVGSCAQVGRGVHLSGGVGLGGVLEPPGARPVIIEDGAFIGSRCIVVEGVIVEERAVLGAGVVLTASTPIVDVTGAEPVEHRGRVPAGALVIPGTRAKRFAAGEYGTPVALIIGRRSAASDALRTAGVRLAIVSAGITALTGRVAADLGMDLHRANTIHIADGLFTGEGEIAVPPGSKARVFAETVEALGVEAEDVVAVGDSPGDIDMFQVAGRGAAFCPVNAQTARAADVIIDTADMRRLVPLVLGGAHR